MHTIYIATVFAGSLVCFLASLLLFFRRKEGKRSRVILAVIVFFSVINYITRFIALINGNDPELVVSGKVLLVANFMILGYILYPIEVIAPGWLNLRRLFKLYSYWIVLVVMYLISKQAGIEYTEYGNLQEMIAHSHRFEVWFRFLLSVLIFIPGIIVFLIHRTHLYQNSDHIWVTKYVVTLSINVITFLLVVLFNDPVFNIVYYYVSVGCSLYIVYMELFDRLITQSVDKKEVQPGMYAAASTYRSSLTEEETPVETSLNKNSPEDKTPENKSPEEKSTWEKSPQKKESVLIQRLEATMNKNKAWRNPDLTLNTLASELFTNRTSLAQALRDRGYENYTNYINRLRIEDFLQLNESGQIQNFQEAFFEAGFRSRSTALRNFRQYTGTTPSEYFNRTE
jgi:AraC-like DNA-binding protein